ncbi:MAG TPA: choice-of-anchor Q domain-containing protein [Streptosporangiaceae bacterium]|nr:choice-of-anchor Q domain-containing protein [Streptosporangiaceae bacterium]
MRRTTGSYTFRIAAVAAAAIGAAGGVVAMSGAAGAAVTVPCSVSSLISAIKAANGAGSGSLSLASGCTYSLTKADNTTDGPNGLPAITGSVSIAGDGATITRSGSAAFRLFEVQPQGSLSLSGLTLSDGLADNGAQGGGAVFALGALSVTSTTFSGNSAPSATGTSGGAINSSGSLSVSFSTFTGNSGQEGGGIFNQSTGAAATITDSTFSGNTATTYGGGAIVGVQGTTNVARDTFAGNHATGTAGGGAIDNDATVKVTDSTFNGNTAGTNGGGAIQNFGTATITWSTISGNGAPFGADLHNDPAPGNSMTVAETIVANGGGGGSNCSGSAAVIDGGYNIDSGTSCGFSAAHGSKSDTDPDLGPLADNGGPTQTMALAADSPAVNAVPVTVPGCSGGTDQRGVSRPQGPACDIGAYELVMHAPPPTIGPGLVSSFADYSRSCLDNSDFRWTPGNRLQLWACGAAGGADQRLELVPVAGRSGVYELRFATGASGGPFCVTQANISGAGPLVLGVCNAGTPGARRQMLTPIPGAGNCRCGVYYRFTGTGLYMDDWAYNTRNGATVGTYRFDGGRNQGWSQP